MSEYQTPIEKVIEALDGPYGDNRTLYAATKELFEAAHFPDPDQFAHETIRTFLDICEDDNIPIPSDSVLIRLAATVAGIYTLEGLSNLPPDPSKYAFGNDAEVIGRIRDALVELQGKAKDRQGTLVLMTVAFCESFVYLARQLPFVAQDNLGGSATIPLIDVLPNVPALVESFIEVFTAQELRDRNLFSRLRKQLDKNVESISPNSRREVRPSTLKGTKEEVVRAFLDGTFMEDIFVQTRVPFTIPDHPYRTEHTAILGSAGSGKTTLIQQIVLDDLARPNPPPMVIVDPKGLLTDRLARLNIFNPTDGRLKDRLVVFDADDNLPLNLFMRDSASSNTAAQNQIIGNFGYIFSAGGFKLTPKQHVDFSYIARLLFSIPGANITTLLDILDEPATNFSKFSFAPYVLALDPISQRFFKNEFFTEFKESKGQIKARLYMVLENPAVATMLAASDRAIDLLQCMRERKVVLINTGMTTLGSSASTLLGRYFIASTLSAAFARHKLGDNSFLSLIVDEYQEFADELKTPEIMRLAREYNLGLTIATQTLHGPPFTESLRASISTNTSIKYASSPEGVDIAYAARDLRSEPEFIREQTKTRTHARFACYVRGLLTSPISVSIPLGNIKPDMQMEKEAYRDLRRQNRASLTPSPQRDRPAKVSRADPLEHPEFDTPPLTPESPAPGPSEPSTTPTSEASTEW